MVRVLPPPPVRFPCLDSGRPQRTGAKRRIGDVIVQLGFAERELVEKAVEKGRAGGVPLGQSLIDAGIVDSNQLAQALAERNGLDYVDLNSFEVDQGAANLIDAAKARRYQTIPISFLGEQTVLVATADPANVLALDDIAMATGYEVRRAVASPEDIDGVIDQLSRLGDAVEELEDERTPPRSSSCAIRPTRRRWSSSCTRSSPTPSGAAHRTSTSSRARRTCACATASTAW